MSHFPRRILACAYTIYSNWNILHSSQLIPFHIQSCVILNSLYTNKLPSRIMRLIVWSLSPHNLHLLFCCILSIFALTLLVLMVLFCAAIRRDSVSLLWFSFLSHVQVFLCEISVVCRLKYPYSYFFFLLLFHNYYCSVDTYVVSGRCNLSFLALFYVVFKSSYRCIDAILDAGESSSSFFSWHI